MDNSLAERIVIDPERATDGPLVHDTGVTVDQILGALVERPDSAFVLQRFPALDVIDIRAAIEYARESAHGSGVESPAHTIGDLGWSQEYAAELRWRLQSFAEDWDDPEMDVYDGLALSVMSYSFAFPTPI